MSVQTPEFTGHVIWALYNDPNLINTISDKVMSVTKEQIQKAARTYLTANNRTVITTVPKPRAGGAQ